MAESIPQNTNMEYLRGQYLAQSYFHGLISDPSSVSLDGYLGDLQLFGTLDEFGQNQMSNGFGETLQRLIVTHFSCDENAAPFAFKTFMKQATQHPL